MAECNLPLKYVLIAPRKRIRTISTVSVGFDSSLVELVVKVCLLCCLLLFIVTLAFNRHSSLEFVYKMKNHEWLLLFFGTGIAAMIAGVFLSNEKHMKDNRIRIIESSDNGIRIGAGKFESDRSFFLSWNLVNAVEAVADKESNEHYLVISTISKKVYEFKWNNAFSWVDEETFFSNVKSNASHAKFNWDIEEVKAKDKLDSRYTNLWLHYFSQPSDRQRRGHLAVGEELQNGLYEIVDKLGGGGQGMAYVAKYNPQVALEIESDTSRESFDLRNNGATIGDDELVVLKEYILPVYRGNSLESEKYDRLSGEARILSALSHDQVVRLYDCFIEDHRGYMVMEHVVGLTLSSIVKEAGAFSALEAVKTGLSVLNILDYIHSQPIPIIHRDIAPDNLIVTKEGVVKLLDFTVAQESNQQRTATVVGKQAYIAPEQFRGSPSVQSDIYSFGCTMFFLLTAKEPNPMEVESLLVHGADFDRDLDQIIQKSTAFDLSDRYIQANEMSRDLRFWLDNQL